MKSKPIGHWIDMGLIQPTTHIRGILLTLISMKPNVLHLKKMLPSDKYNVILSHTITYVLMLHFASLPYFWEIFYAR